MSFFLCKQWFRTVVAALLLALTMFVCGLVKDDFSTAAFKNTQLRKSYYLYSASSNAKEVQTVELAEIPFIEGKSVCLTFESEEEAKAYADTLIEKSGVYLQTTERVDGAESYYLFSRRLGGCVWVAGVPVNLHIVLSGKRVSVGTPIIFGGY